LKVAISTGHSDLDPGAIAFNGTKEYLLNCNLVKEIEALSLPNAEWWRSDTECEKYGYPRHLNCTIKSVNDSDCCCCVEIHHNAAFNKNVRGGMAIYWDTSVKGKMLSNAIAYYLHWMPYFGYNAFKEYWRNTQQYYYKAKDRATLKHIKRRLAFLRYTNIPACIVEPAFISNVEDYFFAVGYVKPIAKAIRDGVALYLSTTTFQNS
jgi:N-acetylmuramoyl-L-alanine amidase